MVAYHCNLSSLELFVIFDLEVGNNHLNIVTFMLYN